MVKHRQEKDENGGPSCNQCNSMEGTLQVADLVHLLQPLNKTKRKGPQK